MSDCRLLVVSCPARRAIQELWGIVQNTNWPDCQFPVDILSPDPDLGWNANLIKYLEGVTETFCLLLLDDHFVDATQDGTATDNMNVLLDLMRERPDIALVKLQAGNAWPPELEFPEWDRLREYDRRSHPFKRTNLVPTMFRREWLLRLSRQVLKNLGPSQDIGRNGAINFEVEGTRITRDADASPERMLGIHRPNADGGGGRSLLACIDNDGVREGKLKVRDQFERITGGLAHIEGIEAFL